MKESLSKSDGGIASVDYAMRLLLLYSSHRELRVSSVAAELGVAKSTAYRLLSTLARRGFVVQDRVTRVYRLGESVIELGLRSVTEYELREAAMPHMRALAASLHETVNLMVLEDEGCRFIGGVEGDQRVRVGVLTGHLLPAHACSGGKLLLSFLDPEDVRARYPRGLRQITSNTHRRLSDLRSDLEVIRAQGYALNDEESAEGLRALAVPVRDRIGRVVGALAVSAPARRLGRAQIRPTITALRESATQVRNALH
jgi:DNA-binding IclR family transcriptional regulator